MDLQNPDQIDLVVGRLFLALKLALESKKQLLPYMREQIINDTNNNYGILSDNEVRDYLKSLQ